MSGSRKPHGMPEKTWLRAVEGNKESANGHVSILDVSLDAGLTDYGNAERIVARHGRDIRYCYAWKSWLVWDGMRWKVDDGGEIRRRAKETARSIYREAANADDEKATKALGAWAKSSLSEARVKSALELAKSEVGIPVSPEELDTDPWLLNCENGTLDLKNGQLRDHDRADLITKLSPVRYDRNAEAPAWERFLKKVLPAADLRRFVQRAAGYSMTGSTRERILLILHGLGRNGKSTLVEALRDVLGNEDGYAAKTRAETLMMKATGGIPNDIAALKGARFVAASETEANRRLAESLVKEITGGDTISARFLHGEYFSFRPEFQVWLATNHEPTVQGTDPAIWDRIKLVPFEVRIEDDEVDPELPDKLRAELPGILAWAVRGCLDWQSSGLAEPEEVKAATAQYRADQDVLAAFIEECCIVQQDAWTKFADLYDAYKTWAEESNEKPEKKRGFGTRLAERGFHPDNGPKNVAVRRGLGLRDDHLPPPEGEDPATRKVNLDSSSEQQKSINQVQEANDARSEVNPEAPGLIKDNPQSSCKASDYKSGVNQGYPKSGFFLGDFSRKKKTQNEVNHVNSLTQDGSGGSYERLVEDRITDLSEEDF